jgi:biopolymer transport protein ExbD
MKDFYYILGVSPKSSLLEIIEAYEKLSPKFDPVLNGHDSFYTRQFNEIREAFHVLTDPAKRKLYNEQLKALNVAPNAATPKKSSINSITPKIDITFSLVLILLTGVFGTYVYRSVYQNGKKAPVTSQPTINPTPPAPLITHHKRKRYINHNALLVAKTSYADKPVASLPIKTTLPVAYAVKKPIPTVAYAASKPILVSKPSVTTQNEESENEVEVRANETGVVYLREYAQFGAPVIKTLQDRTKVIVLEKGSKYYKIQADDVTGYIPRWAIKENEQE